MIDALRSVAETHLALTSVRVLLGALDPRDWSGELAGPLGRYLSEPAPEDSTSLPRSSLTFEQQIVADLDAGRIDETRPDVLDMRPDAVPERLRPRLRELSAAWWPKEPLVEISRFSESGHSAAAAITAAAIGGVELTRERWLELVLAPDHFDFANHVWRWLTDAYDPAWEPEVISVVATADTHALTSVLATAQTPSERLTEAVGARLAQLPSDGWWSNTVGLLRDRGEEAILVGLATASLDPARQAHVDEKLAELGNADAQVRILDRRLAAASRGDAVDTFHWRDPIPDERVIGRLGELLRVLPRTAGTRAGDVRSTVAGALSASRSAAAIDLFDAIAARDDGDQLLATFGAQTVRARLATEAVLSRLPESPALTARLVMHRTRAVHPRKSMRIQ